MIVASWQKHDNMKSTHCCDVGLARTDGSISIGKHQRAIWIASIEISCSD